MNGCKLSPLGLGLSLGILWGLSLVVFGLLAHHYAYGQTLVTGLGALYIGYEPSIQGSLIGGLIGFVNAFITGVLIALLYNLFSSCNCCKKDEKIS